MVDRAQAHREVLPLLALLLSLACRPSLLDRHIEVVPQRPLPATGDTAVITDITFRPRDSRTVPTRTARSLKTSLQTAVANTGRFRDVRLDPEPAPDGSPVLLSFVVTPEERGKTDWTWAWPAIYPLPLLWPVQPHHSRVAVAIQGSGRVPGREAQVFEVRSAREADMRVYGLFRTKPTEEALAACYGDCLLAVTDKVASLERPHSAPSTPSERTSLNPVMAGAIRTRFADKGDTFLVTPVPFASPTHVQMRLEEGGTRSASTGNLLGLGVEHFVARDHSIRFLACFTGSTRAGSIQTDTEDTTEELENRAFTLSHHRYYGNLALGFGLSYQETCYTRSTSWLASEASPSQTRKAPPQTQKAVGLSLSAQWWLSRRFGLDISYNPGVFDPAYSHSLHFGGVFRFRAR